MTLTITHNPSETFERDTIKAGSYGARIVRLIHIGTAQNDRFPTRENGSKNIQNTVNIGFEIPELTYDHDGKTHTKKIYKDYTVSLNKRAALRQLVLACFPETDFDKELEFQVTDLIGKECLITIENKTAKTSGNKYAVITGATSLPKGMAVDDKETPVFMLTYDNWDQESFLTLPDFLQAKMSQSDEFKAKGLTYIPQDAQVDYPENDSKDEIPF